MKHLTLFIGNFIIALLFGWDLMDLYMSGDINIISDLVNRVFISHIGFIVTFLSCVYFIDRFMRRSDSKKMNEENLKLKSNNKKLKRDIYSLVKGGDTLDSVTTKVRWQMRFNLDDSIMAGDTSHKK